MNHRLILDYTARLEGIDVWKVINELLGKVTEYSKPLPTAMLSTIDAGEAEAATAGSTG